MINTFSPAGGGNALINHRHRRRSVGGGEEEKKKNKTKKRRRRRRRWCCLVSCHPSVFSCRPAAPLSRLTLALRFKLQLKCVSFFLCKVNVKLESSELKVKQQTKILSKFRCWDVGNCCIAFWRPGFYARLVCFAVVCIAFCTFRDINVVEIAWSVLYNIFHSRFIK